ncbi:hypothetical protein ACJJTC_000933 [Scirpophaga incertulas]
MGDGLKIVKDKRHRSSSSIAGAVVDGTRSERKLDIRASIPEVDDQFATAEARCHDLLEKIDLVKVIKRKKKIKKRSATRIVEAPEHDENIPFIRVHTQPKKTLLVTEVSQAARMRRLETSNPTRGYLDPATVEQHRMIGHVRGYNQTMGQRESKKKSQSFIPAKHIKQETRGRRAYADGDVTTSLDDSAPPACDDDNEYANFPDDVFDLPQDYSPGNRSTGSHKQTKIACGNRRNVPNKLAPKNTVQANAQSNWRVRSPLNRRRDSNKLPPTNDDQNAVPVQEERSVVELFCKAGRQSPTRQQASSSIKPGGNTKVVIGEQATGPLREEPNREQSKVRRHTRNLKNRSHRYELPTVASQMKQAGVRYYYEHGNSSNIPFIVSKSTSPSHNIGVNIQQVLNGVKIQQPLSGIPLTIAYHMGLRHMPMLGTKRTVMKPSLDIREMNVIRVGKRMLRLPSGRYVSYGRLLALYREGDGLVSRFLRAISRPHYFYTSMFNLATSREDADGATSKGQGVADARQRLAEYAGLYRQYERIERALRDEPDPEMEHRKKELAKELAAREDHIRKVVDDYRSVIEQPLRASMSTADEGYKLNIGDQQQPTFVV